MREHGSSRDSQDAEGMRAIDEYEMLDMTLRRAVRQAAGHEIQGPAPSNEHISPAKLPLFIKHQDFLPNIIKGGGATKLPVYERLNILVSKANIWLKSNPTKKLICCEFLDVPTKDPNKIMHSEKSIHKFDQANGYVYYSKKLRLWYSIQVLKTQRTQELGYRFVIPSAMNISKVIHTTEYETFSCALATQNSNIKLCPLPGEILNVQTLRCKIHSKTNMPEPEETMWRQGKFKDTYFLRVLLIFCCLREKQAKWNRDMFYRDFIPAFHENKYSSFGELVGNLSSWRRGQCDIEVTNVETVEYKTSDYKLQPNTESTFFMESRNGPTHYVTILRVYYTKVDLLAASLQENSLSSRRFSPWVTHGPDCCGGTEHEAAVETRERLAAWVRATGADVLSVQTLPLITRSGEIYLQPDVTYRRCRNPGSFQVVQSYCVHLVKQLETPCNDTCTHLPFPELKSSYCCRVS